MTASLKPAALLLLSAAAAFAADAREQFIATYCVSCHSGSAPAAGFAADALADAAPERLRQVRDYVAHGVMPPAAASAQPSGQDRDRFVAALDAASVARTPARRLNRAEYLNSLRDIFRIREIRLPPAFPEEINDHDFDTAAEGLFVTPALLDSYLDVAADIADRMVLLPDHPTIRTESTRENIGQDEARTKYWSRDGDETGLYFSGLNIAGWSGGFWDTAFVAPASGVYRVRIKAHAEAAAGADGKPLRLGFYALNTSDYDLPKRALRADLPRVGSLEVLNREPQLLDVEVRLEKGEKFHAYCENRLAEKYPDALLREPGDTADLRQLLRAYLDESLASGLPTIRMERMTVSGPIAPLPRQREFLLSRQPHRDAAYVEAVLGPLAERAYRRPLSAAERDDLVSRVLRHMDSAPSPAHGIHFGIRRILTSPQFLYRAVGEGALDDYGLAARLSYFLWSSTPDDELLGLARDGRLADPAVLRAQVGRLISDPKGGRFVESFTDQWLGARKASSVMVCDNRHVWSELIRYGAVRSTRMFFQEILQKNLSVRTFLDSDFTYANEPMRIAWGMPTGEVDLRRLEADQRQSLLWPEPERLEFASLPEDAPAHIAGRGGVLGLSAVLLAGGDGVDSSPVLRGVWVLKNLLGEPPPPPPSDVPALVADVSEARTARELLAAHQSVPSCAACHRSIDPIGLALENYDAAGGWRTSYYREDESQPANPVDARTELPSGEKLAGPADLKRYLLARSDRFTRTLAEKLLVYATGRTALSPRDRRELDALVAAEPPEGYGFRDLLVAVLQTQAFRRK